MGTLIFLLLVVLVATFGFRDTLGAILGATALSALLVLLGLGLMVLLGMFLVRKMGSR